MTSVGISGSKILIVPGYTDAEILQMQGTSGGSTTSNNSVKQPEAFYFDAMNIEYTPHINSYEEFNSSEGLILIEKACDRYAEVTMDVLVHQNLSNMKGSIKIDNQTMEARLVMSDNFVNTEKSTDEEIMVNRYVEPSEFTEEYIELRDNFFADLKGRPLTIVSPLFPAMPVGYMTEATYNINEGEEEATYNVTFRETDNSGF